MKRSSTRTVVTEVALNSLDLSKMLFNGVYKYSYLIGKIVKY